MQLLDVDVKSPSIEINEFSSYYDCMYCTKRKRTRHYLAIIWLRRIEDEIEVEKESWDACLPRLWKCVLVFMMKPGILLTKSEKS